MGWFSKTVKKIRKTAEKVDPIGTKINKAMAKVPGSHQALEEGLYRGAIGEASWNPYSKKGVAVGDVWGGGTYQSQDPRKRAYGRQIGTMIGSYFGGNALSSLFRGGSGAAAGSTYGAAEGMGGAGGIGGSTGASGLSLGTSAEGLSLGTSAAGAGADTFLGSAGTYSGLAGGAADVGGGSYAASGAEPFADLSWASPDYTPQWSPSQTATVESLNNTLYNTETDAFKLQNASDSLSQNWGDIVQPETSGTSTLADSASGSFDLGTEAATQPTMSPTIEAVDGTSGSLDLFSDTPTSVGTESNLWSPPKANYNLKTSFPTSGGNSIMGNLGQYYKWGKLASDLYGGYDSYQQNKDIMGQMRPVADAYQNTARELNELYTNPNRGYNEFMMGEGRQFLTDARAQAAKQGRIGTYMNSGKMNTDLLSLYMRNLENRRAGLSRTLAEQKAGADYYNQLKRNKNAPLVSSGLSALGGLASIYG